MVLQIIFCGHIPSASNWYWFTCAEQDYGYIHFRFCFVWVWGVVFWKTDNSKLMSLNYPLEFVPKQYPIYLVDYFLPLLLVDCVYRWQDRTGIQEKDRSWDFYPLCSFAQLCDHNPYTFLKWKFTSVSSLLVVLKQNYFKLSEGISISADCWGFALGRGNA